MGAPQGTGGEAMSRRGRRALTLAFALTAVATWSAPRAAQAAQSLLTFAPVADAHVRADAPGSNAGTASLLKVDGSPRIITFLRFDVSGVAGSVLDVTLAMHLTDASSRGGTIHRVSDTGWDEAAITWSTKPALDGAQAGAFGATMTPGDDHEVSLGPLIEGDGPLTLAIVSSNADGAAWTSRESATPPTLRVTVTSATLSRARFTAVADTSVNAARPTTALGSSPALFADADPRRIAYLRFAVSGVAGNVVDVRLRLFLRDASPQGGRVWRTASPSWPEATTTWKTRPTLASPMLAPLGRADVTGGWYELSLGTAIASDGKLSIAIDSGSDDAVSWASRESARAPTLDVLTVPNEAETLSFTPTADAWVTEGAPATNLGTGALLEVDLDPAALAYLRFSIRGIGAGREVTGVTLRMRNENGSEVGGRVFWIRDRTWGETTLTWSNRPPIDGEVLRGWTSVLPGDHTLDLGAALAKDGILSLAIDSPVSNKAAWSSRESPNPPALEVAVAPRAPAPDPEPRLYPVVAVVGDVACAPDDPLFNGGAGTPTACRQRKTSNLAVRGDYDAILMLGDAQYEEGSLAEFNAVYDETWGRVKSITRPIPGNHEYRTPGADGYFDYFGTRARRASDGYYSFDIGAWHVVALNTSWNCVPIECDDASPMATWLREDLAANDDACTLAMMHYPRWSSSEDRPSTAALYQAMYEGGVDLLVTGHDHTYERFAPLDPDRQPDPNGIRQFIAGTGGAYYHEISSPSANSEVLNNWTFGILELTLRPAGYDWNYVPVAGQTFTDAGSADCH